MKRLTSQRCNGIKSGYWSSAKKDELIQRLGRYEDTGAEPEDFPRWISTADRLPDTPEESVLVIVSGAPQSNLTLIDAVELGFYVPLDGWVIEQWPDWSAPQVTRWMPIPGSVTTPRKKERGWIRTADRLPTAEYEEVREKYQTTDPLELIVMISGGLAPTMLLWSPEEGFVDELGASYKVTHWMEMPEGPEGET